MKNIKNTQTNNINNQTINKTSSIKKQMQLKSIIFVGLCALVLISICIAYLVMSLGQDNKPPKDRYIDLNLISGSYNIKITDVVKDAKLVTEYSMFENFQFVEIIGETSDVFSFADGKIISIEQTQNRGSVVTIEHVPGMCTVYSFIELNEDIKIGHEISCDQNIGIMYQNEPIVLRFEIILDGENMDPTPYVIH